MFNYFSSVNSFFNIPLRSLFYKKRRKFKLTLLLNKVKKTNFLLRNKKLKKRIRKFKNFKKRFSKIFRNIGYILPKSKKYFKVSNLFDYINYFYLLKRGVFFKHYFFLRYVSSELFFKIGFNSYYDHHVMRRMLCKLTFITSTHKDLPANLLYLDFSYGEFFSYLGFISIDSFFNKDLKGDTSIFYKASVHPGFNVIPNFVIKFIPLKNFFDFNKFKEAPRD